MQRAYELARLERTHPNPRVGAIVVSPDGDVISEGAHHGPGSQHAEAFALDQAGFASRGATLYVTLEPCVHHGRTPPCADRVVGSGVARVVIGLIDPDPRVAGKGVRRLEEAGIDVTVLDDEEAKELDPAYFHHRQTGLPLVTVKWAMTLDGSVAALDGSSRWITSGKARSDSHRLRRESDAVVIGAGTMRADDPLLNVRLADYSGHQPRPIVIAGGGELPQDAKLWERNPIVVAVTERDIPGGELVIVGGDGLPDPMAACRTLGGLGYLGLLLEGGPTLAGAWWEAGVISRGVVYVGARLGGGGGMPPLATVFATIEDARNVRITGVERVGPDLRIEFESED